ncbi:MAG: transcription elongation factor GreB, partial [Salinisphaera sp.]|nr:transcription elongation factor GreB [Salinisphaera sp.]
MWRRRRPEVVRALTAAAAEGDRSENAEYSYRKKELREIDRRLRYLDGRLKRLTVVDTAPADKGRVYFGAWVTVADAVGKQYVYRIV